MPGEAYDGGASLRDLQDGVIRPYRLYTAASYEYNRSSRFPLWRHQLRASVACGVAWRGQGQRQPGNAERVGAPTVGA